LLFCCVYEQYE